MRSIWTLVFCVACSVDHSGLLDSDGGPGPDIELRVDSGPLDSSIDSSPPFDAGSDGGPPSDVPDVFDGGTDVPVLVDAGTPDVPADVPPMIDAGPPDAGCMEGTSRCDGNTREVCTSAGWSVDDVCGLECRESEARASCFDLVPSNIVEPLSAVPATAMGDVIVTDATWNTDECEDFDNFWYVQPVPGEIELCVLAYENVTFENEIRLVGTRGLVVVATGTITLDAVIRADGNGTEPGPGAPSGAAVSGFTSPYSGGDGENESVTGVDFDSDGGGGGGGGFGEGGDGGSGGGNFGTSVADGGAGGTAFGATYIPLRAGGAGGVGGEGASRGFGGGGGGAIQFSARGDIFVNSGINISGGRGEGGEAGNGNAGAGGGGGAGGTLLLESAGTVRFDGAEVLAAGGGGGGGGACNDGADGEEEEQDIRTRGGARGRGCALRYTTNGASGSSDGDGADAGDFGRAGSNGGGGGGGGGLVVIRGSAEEGVLAGSGHRVSADPEIAAVE